MTAAESTTSKAAAFGSCVSKPPSNKDWNEIGRVYLPIVRLGYLGTQKTPEDYLASLIQNDVPEAVLGNLIVDIMAFREAVTGFASLLDAALDRNLAALADLRLHHARALED